MVGIIRFDALSRNHGFATCSLNRRCNLRGWFCQSTAFFVNRILESIHCCGITEASALEVRLVRKTWVDLAGRFQSTAKSRREKSMELHAFQFCHSYLPQLKGQPCNWRGQVNACKMFGASSFQYSASARCTFTSWMLLAAEMEDQQLYIESLTNWDLISELHKTSESKSFTLVSMSRERHVSLTIYRVNLPAEPCVLNGGLEFTI